MKNLKNIFCPTYNTIINIAAYSLLGALLSIAFDEAGFVTAGIFVGAALFFLHIFYLRKFQMTTKAQHLVVLTVTIVVLLLLLVYHALTIKRSDYFLLILSLASLSPFYNFCGYVRFTVIDEKTTVVKYILGIMMIPFTAFLIYNHYLGTNYKTIYLIVIVGAYYFVIFALIKIAALIIKEKNLIGSADQEAKAHDPVTFFLTIFMPVTGLLLNQYMYSYSSQYAKQTGYTFRHQSEGFFGDFSHPIFYGLTIINGISLLIPLVKFDKLRLPIFFMRSIGYSFILYMFVVFLPVFPVGVLALFFIVGIYAFVPLLITWWQGKILLKDYRALIGVYKKKYVTRVFILGMVTLPVILASVFVYDKLNFNRAIAYADQSNTDATGKVDVKALQRTLNSQSAYTYRTRLYGSSIRTYYSYRNIPIISSAYKLFVFKRQKLDYQCQNMLNALFFDGYYYNNSYDSYMSILDYYSRNKYPVGISDINCQTSYDESIQAYRTWVDIKLENNASDKNEYRTLFTIPDGVYISDYYLYVGDEKKYGLLTDRRAAMTIYRKIVLQQLDPGILHYVDENSLELRVYPFIPYETRETGFELIHKNSLEFLIDGYKVEARVDDSALELRLPNAVLLSSDEIKKLPPLHKEPEYYFIMDCSENSDMESLSYRILNYCAYREIDNAVLYLSTYRFDKYSVSDINKIKIEKQGGFNLSLAVKDIIKNAGDEKVPIIFFVTDNEDDRIISPKQIRNYASPESENYYRLNSDFSLTPYSLFTNNKSADVQQPIINNVVSYNGSAVVNDGTDKLIVLNEEIPERESNQYLEAAALAVEYKINMKNGVKNPLSYIKKSFLSHILTPSTAFIVVETKEQEEELLKLQEEILKKQELMESNNLSEPHTGALAVLVCLYIVFARVRSKRCLQLDPSIK